MQTTLVRLDLPGVVGVVRSGTIFRVQVKVHVGVEERFLGQDVGVDGELVVLYNVVFGGMILDGGIQGAGLQILGGFCCIGGVDEENGLEDVAEVACEVGLELIGHASNADEKAVN